MDRTEFDALYRDVEALRLSLALNAEPAPTDGQPDRLRIETNLDDLGTLVGTLAGLVIAITRRIQDLENAIADG